MGATKIEWCDYTANFWRGCQKVSAGCANCYADAQSKRSPDVLGIWGPPGVGRRVVAAESYWRLPEQWDRKAAKDGVRRRVFCGSLMDWAEDWEGPMHASAEEPLVTGDGATWHGSHHGPGAAERLVTMNDVRRRMFDTTKRTRNLDWLLLTKRPENVPAIAAELSGFYDFFAEQSQYWLGTSIEDQATADVRIPALLRIPAAIRFLSVEPLLGPVDLEPWLHCDGFCPQSPQPDGAYHFDRCPIQPDGSKPKIDWVIVGSESGPNARPMNEDWVRSLRDQCQAAVVLFFYKQRTEGGKKVSLPELDGRVWNEYPQM
jgi:protein gp37